MKILIVYYSRTSTTKKIAETLQKELNADVEEVQDIKNRRGFLGYLFAGQDATFGSLTDIKEVTKNPTEYDIVIIGTPIWAWNVTPAIRTYLTKFKGQFKKIVFFCTEGNNGGKRAFEEMEKICGIKPLATLELTTREVVKNNYQEKIKVFINKIL